MFVTDVRFQQLSNQKVDTVVESMQKQGLIKDAITSYKLSRFSDGKNDGEVTFGAMDPAKYDAGSLITFKNVNQDGYWEGNISSFKMNGKDLKLTGKSGILDTGTVSLSQSCCPHTRPDVSPDHACRACQRRQNRPQRHSRK